eukprot:1987135-Amphidinium_carterae.1
MVNGQLTHLRNPLKSTTESINKQWTHYSTYSTCDYPSFWTLWTLSSADNIQWHFTRKSPSH